MGDIVKRQFWFVLFVLLLCTTALCEAKEKLVLLPLDSKGLTASEKKLYQGAIKSELSKKYKIYSGDEVEAKLKKFSISSCTSDECLEKIAIAFNGHLVGRGNLTFDSNRTPLLGLEIKDIFTNEDVFSESKGCKGCDGAGIIEMFKTMAAGRSTAGGGTVAYVNPSIEDGPATEGIVRVTPKVSENTGSKIAALFFDSDPSGAGVYLGDTFAGHTPYQNLSLKPGQTIQVMLKKDGYHDKRVELTLSGGTNELGTLSMTSLYGTLKVDSSPGEADVYVGGKRVGVTPYTNNRMRAGAYLISVRKEFYKPMENRRVVVTEEKTSREKIDLKANFGTLKITSTPSGADVIIAGKKVGTTPFTEKRMLSGAYLVSLRKDLYLPVENYRAVVRDEESTRESFNLKANYGTLNLDSIPSGVFFDVKNTKGESVRSGSTPSTIKVTPGDYTLALTKDGYAPLDFKVVIARDKILAINKAQALLRKLQGDVIVSSEPYIKGAKVLVDGCEAGALPLSLPLAAGSHEIEVKTEEMVGMSKVMVDDGDFLTVKVGLIRSKGEFSKDKKTFRNSIGMKFVRIDPGTFMMGSSTWESGRGNDEIRHRVTLSKGFYMQITEVTQEQWKRVMGNNPSRFRNCGDDYPVEYVSWKDAQAFIKKLNKMEEGNFYRLPTEAQWEYACRAGSSGSYSWGESADPNKMKYENDSDSNEGKCADDLRRRGLPLDSTVEVASFPPNAWGLYDMHGNVWEWCQDKYKKKYPLKHVTDPTGPFWGGRRVLRGGSWFDEGIHCRSSNRMWMKPESRLSFFGIRLIRDSE